MARTPDGMVARETVMSMRLAPTEEATLDRQRSDRGGMTRSGYVRWLIREDGKRIAREKGQS